MSSRSTQHGSSDPTDVDALYASVDALLVARRPADALRLVDQFVVTDPGGFHGQFLRAQCLLALDRLGEAERSWRAASTLEPDHLGCSVVGVRCALNSGDVETAWSRVERLHSRQTTDARARYWYAVVAARTGRVELALDTVASMRHADPAGELPILTAGEVDLQIAVHRKAGRAPLAEQIAAELLGKDPFDPRGHDLLARATSLGSAKMFGRRGIAERRLRHIRNAARAGIQPNPGQVRALTVEAVGPVVLVVAWAGGVFLGAPLGELYGAPVTVGVFVVWVVLYVLTRRRTARVVAALPAAGRRLVLEPVVRTIRTCAVALAVIATIGLVVLHPVTQAHAVELGFSRSKPTTKTVVIQPSATTEPRVVTAPLMSPVGLPPNTLSPQPTLPSPSIAPGFPPTPTFAPITTTPPIPTFTVPPVPQIPQIREVVVPAKDDPERAWSLMAYYATAAAVSLLVAGMLGLQARSLGRS